MSHASTLVASAAATYLPSTSTPLNAGCQPTTLSPKQSIALAPPDDRFAHKSANTPPSPEADSSSSLPSPPETCKLSRRARPDAKEDWAPRPPNAWILYRSDKSQELKRRKLHDATANMSSRQRQAEMSREISVLWKNESQSVKDHYVRKADKERAEHRQRYPNYKYRPKRRTVEPSRSMYALRRHSSFDPLQQPPDASFDPSVDPFTPPYSAPVSTMHFTRRGSAQTEPYYLPSPSVSGPAPFSSPSASMSQPCSTVQLPRAHSLNPPPSAHSFSACTQVYPMSGLDVGVPMARPQSQPGSHPHQPQHQRQQRQQGHFPPSPNSPVACTTPVPLIGLPLGGMGDGEAKYPSVTEPFTPFPLEQKDSPSSTQSLLCTPQPVDPLEPLHDLQFGLGLDKPFHPTDKPTFHSPFGCSPRKLWELDANLCSPLSGPLTLPHSSLSGSVTTSAPTSLPSSMPSSMPSGLPAYLSTSLPTTLSPESFPGSTPYLGPIGITHAESEEASMFPPALTPVPMSAAGSARSTGPSSSTDSYPPVSSRLFSHPDYRPQPCLPNPMAPTISHPI